MVNSQWLKGGGRGHVMHRLLERLNWLSEPYPLKLHSLLFQQKRRTFTYNVVRLHKIIQIDID